MTPDPISAKPLSKTYIYTNIPSIDMRFQGKDIGLTYSQANGLLQIEVITRIKKERNLDYYCVSSELHQDGGIHYHVHLQYSKIKDIKNEKYFNIIKGEKEYHPSIEVLKHPTSWNTYVKKDNIFVESGSYQEVSEFDPFTFARNNDYEPFLKQCIKKRISATYAQMIWNHVKSIVFEVTTETEIKGTISPILAIINIQQERRSPLLIGPTGCGKTTYAKLHCSKPALFVSHIDQLKQFNPSKHKSIIFDDMDFTHWPTTGQIAIADYDDDRAINVKHSIALIPKHTEKWFTCNRMPFHDLPEIKRRLNIINLY